MLASLLPSTRSFFGNPFFEHIVTILAVSDSGDWLLSPVVSVKGETVHSSKLG